MILRKMIRALTKTEQVSGVGSSKWGTIAVSQKMKLDQRLEKDKMCEPCQKNTVFARGSQARLCLIYPRKSKEVKTMLQL